MAKKRRQTGVAVDAFGGPTVDPTQNVLDLNEASVKRLDDLRRTENEATRRTVSNEIKHISDTAELRAKHYRELRQSESSRINAILINIAETAQLTASAAEARATTLANQVTNSADAMRSSAAAMAQQSNETLDRRFDPLQKAIEEIRRFQFETQGGREQVHETQSKNSNVGMWIGIGVAALIGAISLVLGIVDVMLKLQSP